MIKEAAPKSLLVCSYVIYTSYIKPNGYLYPYRKKYLTVMCTCVNTDTLVPVLLLFWVSVKMQKAKS